MTIDKAINTADALKPNKYDYNIKVEWLSNLDKMITDQIIRKHEDTKDFVFEGYTEDADPATELLVPEPFSEMYIPYLHSKMDLFNQDYNRYNSSTAAYYTAYSNYAQYYNREHEPIRQGIKII